MKYLLDTDHISVLQQQAGPDYAALSARIAQHSPLDLAVSIVSFHEQLLGCNNYINRARSSTDLTRGYAMLERLQKDDAVVSILAFDASVALGFDGLIAQKVRIGSMDLRIAAIAISWGLILLTRNLRDFRRVPGLVTEDWTV